MYDIIIVGAGLVGLYLAKLLKGFNVLVLETKREIGGKVCSGLVSTNLDRFIPIKPEFLEHKVEKAFVYFSGKVLELEKNKIAAYIIDRNKFDKYLAKSVKSEIFLNTKVEDIDMKKNFVEVKTNKGIYKSKMLVGCDGSDSIVRKKLGFKVKEIVNGTIAIVLKKNSSGFVELWFERGITDYFLWKIPRGKLTEYGMMGGDFKKLEKFFGLKTYKKKAAPIPIGTCKSYSERVLLVGDAAGQTKPWSGGGVIYGLICATCAAKTISEAFKRNDFSENFLRQYEKEWKKKIGRSIRTGMFFRWLYRNSPDFVLRAGFYLLKMFERRLKKLDMDLIN